ncbi:uncharacterized protein LOC115889881 [Sitophilus oryzae]|uniref:Uncharacterized protein LOC115889881 n=1 Tax=Sitophilus oryzae TaxID=7048 RepID=A0A6J2YSR7_SITOR|nr:uncharacterized protein LOC115889881 [Sitophilus oryzae]
MHLIFEFVFIILFFSSVLGEEYTLETIGAKKCALNFGTQEINYELTINNEKDGAKSLTLEFNLDEPITKDFTYRADINIMTSGQYIHYIEPDGNVCKDINDLGKIAWDAFRNAVNPKIKDLCTIPPGKYKLEKFQVKKGDFDVPIPTAGQFMAQFHLHNKKGLEVACLEMEFRILEN